jgi:CRISPR-associated endonuclease/helicase Cas3
VALLTIQDKVSLNNFWGKAQLRAESGSLYSYHPLPCHAFDVAAVGKVWLETDKGLTRWLGGQMGILPEKVVALLTPLLALHDLGKFAAAFQAKAEPFPINILKSGDRKKLPDRFQHDNGGLSFVEKYFDGLFPSADTSSAGKALQILLAAVIGHHGVPPRPIENQVLRDYFWPEGIAAAQGFCQLVTELFGWPTEIPSKKAAKQASTIIAGFCIACDWLGSNQRYFPYVSPETDLDCYWREAQSQAKTALSQAGLIGAKPRGSVRLTDILKRSDVSESPLQSWATEVALPEGPLMILMEDETGSGKTEAALLLASRLMAEGRASGIYTALPTMATANALYDRLSDCYQALFMPDEAPSLALVHGRSHLRDAFRTLELAEGDVNENYDDEPSASTNCSAWLRDDRRKAFLADIGAGTIDQALLAILPVRFQALRFFGLSRRVLILDEIHGYDSFVSMEVERLITWQVAQGGSCILLSATLPLAIRRRLMTAYSLGLGTNIISPEDRSYPAATLVSKGCAETQPIKGRAERARQVPVQFLSSPDIAIDAIAEAAAQGCAVAYIRNTVDDALEAHAALVACGIDAFLFHARFALADRFARENDVVRCFGKDSKAAGRYGQVLVSTQVIEQSLDLDFDLMVTDLAPVDLIIQRAGRLWRHARPERTGEPRLLIVSPEPVTSADKDWYGRMFPRAQWVYRDHGGLWLTADVLTRAGMVETPGGVRELVEAVYGEEAQIPSPLEKSRLDAFGKKSAHRAIANSQLLNPNDGYARTGAWESDTRAETRLNDRVNKMLRLAVIEKDCIVPYATHPKIDTYQSWTLSEVPISGRRAGGSVIPPEFCAQAEVVRQDWKRFDQDKLLVLLEPSSQEGVFQSRLTDHNGVEYPIEYSPVRGLVFPST